MHQEAARTVQSRVLRRVFLVLLIVLAMASNTMGRTGMTLSSQPAAAQSAQGEAAR